RGARPPRRRLRYDREGLSLIRQRRCAMEPIDVLESPLSRRSFARILGLGAALAAVPGASQASGTAKARHPAPHAVPPADDGIVRLSANENPYGPSRAALQAMHDAFC